MRETYEAKEKSVGPEVLRDFEKFFMLQTVDTLWKDHLLGLDHLKEGIGLRGYGQRDPLVEYKKESFQLFEAMKEGDRGADPPVPLPLRGSARARREATRRVPRRRTSQARTPAAAAAAGSASLTPRRGRAREAARQKDQQISNFQGSFDPTSGGDFEVSTVKAAGPKVGRNDPCPCGSGKKYKKCHGASGAAAAG